MLRDWGTALGTFSCCFPRASLTFSFRRAGFLSGPSSDRRRTSDGQQLELELAGCALLLFPSVTNLSLTQQSYSPQRFCTSRKVRFLSLSPPCPSVTHKLVQLSLLPEPSVSTPSSLLSLLSPLFAPCSPFSLCRNEESHTRRSTSAFRGRGRYAREGSAVEGRVRSGEGGGRAGCVERGRTGGSVETGMKRRKSGVHIGLRLCARGRETRFQGEKGRGKLHGVRFSRAECVQQG
jgi:hypothetical protein